ncbi:MAG TPA: ABC transporter permease [Chthoniobacterales bacterium]|jgi:putative ABC transport system permease protein|nr:ABC transporter permease [Chthoniobacterales bacterium]
MINDIRYAFRQLLKAPSFSTTAIVALALGIGATTAMFAVIYAFLLRPLPYSDPEKLVMLQSRSTRSGSDVGVNYLDFQDWKKQARSFSDLAFFNLRWNGNVESPGGATETLKTTFTTANLFSLLGVGPILGRDLTPADDEPQAPKVMLISERLWNKTFGRDPTIVGRDIRLDGTPRTVVGIMPAGFRFPSQTDIWVPMASVFGRGTDRSWRADQAIGRVRPDVTLSQAHAEMSLIAERLAQQYPDTNKEIGAAVVPLRDHVTGEVRFSLLLLLAACGGLLLIACANVGQLLLARATTRERELSVRAALGASRWRLARQVITESALLAVLGSVAGVFLAVWLVDVVAAAIPVELPFWIRIDLNPAVLGFAVAVSCLTTLLAGSLPALQAARVGIATTLKATSANTVGAGARSREILTAAQVAVSIVLLVGAGLVLRSLLKLHEVDPGFDPRRVVLMEVNPTYNADESAQARVDRYVRLLQRLSALPGVEAVGANNSPPFVAQRPWNRAQYMVDGKPVAEQSSNPVANFQTVSPDYFRTLGIPLLRGRQFSDADSLTAPRVCIVSERLSRAMWPNEDPVGRRLHLGGPGIKPEAGDWMTIVGVVGDVRHQALEREAGPDLYKPTLQLAWKQMHFVVRTKATDPLSLVSAIRREVAAAAPEVGVFNFVSLEQEVANSLWQSRLRGWLLGFFSIVALALAATGLYGAVAYGVAQRTREIGIRMALGATRGRVLRLVLGQGMRAVLLGVITGVVGAAFLSRLLQATLFGVQATDLPTYAVACFVLAAIAAIAALIPARRASRVNPMEALRTE